MKWNSKYKELNSMVKEIKKKDSVLTGGRIVPANAIIRAQSKAAKQSGKWEV